jgi:hypothetical protein
MLRKFSVGPWSVRWSILVRSRISKTAMADCLSA